MSSPQLTLGVIGTGRIGRLHAEHLRSRIPGAQLVALADLDPAAAENCRQAAYGYDQRVEVFGSLGSIVADNCYPNTAVVQGQTTIYRDLPLNFFMDRYTQSYLEEMRQFVHAVQTGGLSPVPGEAARVPVVMARAARRSCDENRPVRLAEIG
jgi:myo-inositol 2-dehydrogenase/D-chiro-inositol 1-dehydrogenase